MMIQYGCLMVKEELYYPCFVIFVVKEKRRQRFGMFSSSSGFIGSNRGWLRTIFFDSK